MGVVAPWKQLLPPPCHARPTCPAAGVTLCDIGDGWWMMIPCNTYLTVVVHQVVVGVEVYFGHCFFGTLRWQAIGVNASSKTVINTIVQVIDIWVRTHSRPSRPLFSWALLLAMLRDHPTSNVHNLITGQVWTATLIARLMEEHCACSRLPSHRYGHAHLAPRRLSQNV